MGGQEGCQVASDGRVRRVGQTELLESRASADWPGVQPNLGEKTLHQQFPHFLLRDLHLQSAPDQPGAGTGQVDREAFGRIGAQEGFLDLAACADQDGPLARFEFALPLQLSLDVMRQRQIEVVAAEDQVLAHRHPVEPHLAVRLAAHADQREVARPATDVTHEDFLAWGDLLLPVVRVLVDPGIKCRLGLFDQHNPGQAGHGGRLDRQLAGDLVERGRQRQHKVLLGQGVLGELLVPRLAHVAQVAPADIHRRQPLHVRCTMPWQYRRRPVNAGVTQPRLGRDHQTPRHQGPMVSGKKADRVARRFFVPREF